MTLWSAWWVWIMLALGVTFAGSFGWALATFGAISLVATLAIRYWLGPRRSETKIIHDDING